MLDPVVQAATLERVVHVAGSVRREDHDRGSGGLEHSELGHRDLEVAQHLEQVRLELVVGAIDLVDQQHRRGPVAVGDRPQQGPLDEESFLVQVGLDRVGGPAGGLARRLGGSQVQELAGIVPVVHGLGGVDPLVALESDQFAAGPGRQHLGEFGLADAGLALEQQRALELQGQEHRRREALVGEVPVLGECSMDVGRCHAATLPVAVAGVAIPGPRRSPRHVR